MKSLRAKKDNDNSYDEYNFPVQIVTVFKINVD